MSMQPFLGKPPESHTPDGKPAKKSHKRDYRVAVIVGVVVLAAGYGIASVIGGDATPRKRVMDTVALRLVPPPPPPPKQEPPPPPPKLVEKQKIDPPVDKPETPKPMDAPPPGPLALDAKGGAGSDSFGLGGKQGGADYTGGGGTRYGHYSILMQSQIKRALADFQKLAGTKYSGTVRIHLTANGGISSVEVLRMNSDSDVNGLVQQAIATISSFSEAPPADMPTTVVLKVNSATGGA
jgi:periplasmic protein TonB